MKILFSLCILLFFLNDIQSQTIDVITGLNSTSRLLINSDELYYSHSDKVSKINITDPIPNPVNIATGLDNPSGIAIKDSILYIADFNAGKILKTNIIDTLGVLTNFITGLNSPNTLLIVGDYLYFSDNIESKVYKVDLTQSNPIPVELISIGLSFPVGLSLNGNDLYIAGGIGLNGKLHKIDITDSSPTVTEVLADLNQPLGIRLEENDIYIAELKANKISKVNITDSSLISVDVVTGLNEPRDVIFHERDMYILETTKILKIENIVSSVENVSLKNTYKLFPNPSTDFIQIANINDRLAYRISDLKGQNISTGYILPGESINIESFPKGTYILSIDNERSFKFIKK